MVSLPHVVIEVVSVIRCLHLLRTCRCSGCKLLITYTWIFELETPPDQDGGVYSVGVVNKCNVPDFAFCVTLHVYLLRIKICCCKANGITGIPYLLLHRVGSCYCIAWNVGHIEKYLKVVHRYGAKVLYRVVFKWEFLEVFTCFVAKYSYVLQGGRAIVNKIRRWLFISEARVRS